MLRRVMYTAVLFLGMFSTVTQAELLSCDQQQLLCENKCKVVNFGDDAGLQTCKARCLGKRASCSLSVGAEKAREMAEKAASSSENLGDKAKAFWKGLKE